MADAKQCDRCKAFYVIKDNDKFPSIYERQVRVIGLYDARWNEIESLELCPKCADELLRWLDSYSYMPAPINYNLPIEGDVKEVSYDRNVSRPSVTGDEKDQDGSGEDSKESRKD